MERVNLTDPRLYLEASILRDDFKKHASEYVSLGFQTNPWTLGPDSRCPTLRGHQLIPLNNGERVQTQHQAD
eukprot:10550670-Karenia_brevis.AAC.1